MSFSGSAKRVTDESQPLGRRVMCLYECLEQFNLFGFTATRERLMAMVGVAGGRWTAPQLHEALNALSDARRSWLEFLTLAEERRSVEKRAARTPDRPILLAWHTEWLDEYLTGDMAASWKVDGLGECTECSHLLIHHGTWACSACGASPLVPWDARCRQTLPPAAAVPR